MKGRSYQSNFTMGQISAELGGRVDLAAYAAGVREMRNFIPAVTGPARRRAGFLDEGPVADQAKRSALLTFSRRVGDVLSLELGENLVRFRQANGAPVMNGLIPYEIASPWTVDQVRGLCALGSNDVIYFTHRSSTIPPYVLQRRGALDWVFLPLTNRNGPWREENTNQGLTLEADGVSGVVNLTASGDVFLPEHVGTMFRLRENGGNPSIYTWGPDFDPIDYQLYLSDGKVYRTDLKLAGKKTGTTPPLHDEGTVTDGNKPWTYVHDGAGVVRIDTVISPTQATATVLATLPTSGNATGQLPPPGNPAFPATRYWAEGAWSDLRGWPCVVQETDQERLLFGGTLSEPGALFATRSYGFGPDWVDFKPGLGTGRVTDDDAIKRTVGAGGDPITWLQSSTAIFVGTARAERAWGGDSLDDPVTPAKNGFRPLSDVGGEPVDAAKTFDGMIFVPRGGRDLNQIRLGADQGYSDAELGIFAEDLLAAGIVKIVWAPHPDRTLWVLLANGHLLSLVYHPRQNLFGWSQHPLGGGFLVEDMAVVPGTDGRDTLWLTVYREKNGVPQRRIWRQAPRWARGFAASEIYYLDGLRIYEGPPTSLLSGLDAYEGETVRVMGDNGRVVTSGVVQGGNLVLDEEVSRALVGLRYSSRVESLPLDLAGPAGTIGQLQRVLAVTQYLTDFVVGAVSFGPGPAEEVGGAPWGQIPTPEQSVNRTPVGGVSDRMATAAFETDDVWPATVLALRAENTIGDS